MSVSYHRPDEPGTCDDCDSITSRASHKMPDGDDVCGYCYGVRKGYIASENDGGTE